MAQVFINGLLPGDDSILHGDNGGSIVALLNPKFVKTDKEFKILVKYANSDGEVHAQIDNTYIGENLLLRIRDSGTLPIEAQIKVENYGACYSAKIMNDGLSSGSHPIINWDSEISYSKAQDEMHEYIKQHRFSNPIAKYIHMLVVAISVLLGLFIPGVLGVIAAAIFVIIAEVIGPYALGLKPFRLTKRSSKDALTRAA
ncbi:MAG: hypothetical protein Q9M92_07360 [Enterobacterales bacterium]|nr:hypothetical protein [Enterobacterales bacterium]